LLHPQALALEFGERADASHDGTQLDNAAAAADSTFYEITIATVDQPKLLSRLSDAMVGLLQGCWNGPGTAASSMRTVGRPAAEQLHNEKRVLAFVGSKQHAHCGQLSS
jgi:hypothetical protein